MDNPEENDILIGEVWSSLISAKPIGILQARI